MSALVSFQCPVEGCEVMIPDTTGEVQAMFLQTHNQSSHGALTTALPGDTVPENSRGGKTQKLERPKIPADCSEVQWAFFMEKWADFKRFYKLTDRQEIYSHLRECLSDGLQYKLYAVTGGTANQLTEEQLVEEIKRLAVNTAVHVKEFLEMRQDAEEPVRQFKARL